MKKSCKQQKTKQRVHVYPYPYPFHGSVYEHRTMKESTMEPDKAEPLPPSNLRLYINKSLETLQRIQIERDSLRLAFMEYQPDSKQISKPVSVSPDFKPIGSKGNTKGGTNKRNTKALFKKAFRKLHHAQSAWGTPCRAIEDREKRAKEAAEAIRSEALVQQQTQLFTKSQHLERFLTKQPTSLSNDAWREWCQSTIGKLMPASGVSSPKPYLKRSPKRIALHKNGPKMPYVDTVD